MYVCVCHALTDRDVRAAESEGAARGSEVFRHFGLKPQCGRCVSSMHGMLGKHEPGGDRRHATDAAAPAVSVHRDSR